MSRLLIILLVSSGLANAECFTRSTSKSVLNSKIERTADIKRQVTHERGTLLCRVTFRAFIDNQWYTAEGENKGPDYGSIDQICAGALQTGRTSILSYVAGSSINMQQEMTCTDEPIPHTKSEVQIGDIVKESELQPHPNYKFPFKFHGGICRWFVESRPTVGGLNLQQGIICRDPSYVDQMAWRVVDKW